jgi:hypothetical protein
MQINFNQLISDVKQFSSSSTCLSLNLLRLRIGNINDIPFNSTKLQRFLESMTELKQFHVYAKLDSNAIPSDIILLSFQDQFWFDHHWSFGMHGRNYKYFYTLPFHFDYLYEFYNGFNDVRSNHSDILITNSRLWYNVKSIGSSKVSKYDLNFIEELKMKMPKLTFMKFHRDDYSEKNQIKDISPKMDEKEKILVTLNNVTAIQCTKEYDVKECLIYAVPNLRHLILSDAELASIDSELGQIFNERIQQLDILGWQQSFCVFLKNFIFIF